MTYTVKQTGKKWVVITPDGLEANEHKHATQAEADMHCMYLSALFDKNIDTDADERIISGNN